MTLSRSGSMALLPRSASTRSKQKREYSVLGPLPPPPLLFFGSPPPPFPPPPPPLGLDAPSVTSPSAALLSPPEPLALPPPPLPGLTVLASTERPVIVAISTNSR